VGKHKQSARIGDVSDFSSPNLPLSDTERIVALERRVSLLEELLNDVMIQLDKPTQNQSFGKSKPPQKREKPKKPVPPPTDSKKKAKPKLSEHDTKAQEASQQKLLAEVSRVETYLSDGEKRTESQIRDACELSKKAFRRVMKTMDQVATDNAEDRSLRLYWKG